MEDVSADKSARKVPVWDPIVRIGHWTLVLAFFTAYFTGDEFTAQHVWAGYVVAITLVIRILWGFVGSKHARFSDFVRGPGAVFGYLAGLINNRPKRHLGHNPAGGAMIIALLFSLSATVFSGMALYAAEDGKGPLAGVIAAETGPAVNRAAGQEEVREDEDDDEAGEGAEEVWEDLHEFFVYLTLALIGLHIFGVVMSSLAHRENLARAMVTGRKRAEQG